MKTNKVAYMTFSAMKAMKQGMAKMPEKAPSCKKYSDEVIAFYKRPKYKSFCKDLPEKY